MTMMVHYLAVLPPGKSVSTLTDKWRDEVTTFRESRFEPWHGAPAWMHDRPHKQLDWGTIAYELDGKDVDALTAAAQAPLRDGERYAAIWVECY
ncbi:MAG: hypothetical protein GC190_16700 [Alphaproteobacteria bacterium]|nr:hypothetical protein [Alphaproteobacteria bacterium]